jgi:hydroxymethylglutaryl-CoA lyase
MSLPKSIHISEEGPREGFQFEKGAIPTQRKIEFIDALAETGLDHIQIVSFVNPKAVPGMADAEEVVRGIHPKKGVAYTGLWFNEKGLERAVATGRLEITGSLFLSASEPFLKLNNNRTNEQVEAEAHRMIELYQEHGIPVERCGVMAAFGCNFAGDVPVERVTSLIAREVAIAQEHGVKLKRVMLADTMAWGTPNSVKRLVGAVQDRFPEIDISLHLHDTRGMGIANAFAGLEMGVHLFDASVAGLGGCPFAGHKGAAGNVCTEDLVFMCDEMGIETGIDLEAISECARMAEDVVGHDLPGSVMKGGSLKRLRERLQAR